MGKGLEPIRSQFSTWYIPNVRVKESQRNHSSEQKLRQVFSLLKMSADPYDVAIIGGGVVGCAVLFELCRQGYLCLLCEAKECIMSGASAGNSGMLHTGFDAPLGSLELQCIQHCQKEIFGILQKFNIPFEKCGAHVVAWTIEEKEKLQGLLQHSHEAQISSAAIQSATNLYNMEPSLRSGALSSLYVPEEAIVDSNLLGVCYAHHAQKQRSKILTSCTITGFRENVLTTTHGPIKARIVINCAGLYGDTVDALAGLHSFQIKPRTGQYCVFGKEKSHLLHSMIFPVPTERTKGTVLFRTVYGNIVMGPTAEETQSRDLPKPDTKTDKILAKRACHLMPALRQPIGSYVGVRPATQWKDYLIKKYPEIGWLTVGGIRSTGVSGSLGIAHYVSESLKTDFDLEPSQGASKALEEMCWKSGEDGASVIMDDYTYPMSHPIFQFGHGKYTSKL
ncbi:FAD/NAD(p)-binding oxidoreductase [Plakobranchus ocellatus]|uniref:FAD/NAD(P)-binding oxidoreductase n=1 Tax=Plakobranchus ocellatus TaxID=259542 RepID=A0AAV4DDE0_9GAST|nr:FAD/NAD(p)-binding oxidoreductase [Plakobranchus ocellatus]